MLAATDSVRIAEVRSAVRLYDGSCILTVGEAACAAQGKREVCLILIVAVDADCWLESDGAELYVSAIGQL